MQKDRPRAHGEPARGRCPAGLGEHVVLECGRVDARLDRETLVERSIRRIEQRTAIVEHDLAPWSCGKTSRAAW